MSKELQLTVSASLLLRGERTQITPWGAWIGGTNLRAASKHEEVRAWLFLEVSKLVKDIDAKKTIQTDEEMQFACRTILDECPTLKMEELHLIFDHIRMGKFGKLYERLKIAEILDCIAQYEGNVRAEMLEKYHHQLKVEQNKPTHRKLEPLNLAAILDQVNEEVVEEEKPKEGIGTRLGKQRGWK